MRPFERRQAISRIRATLNVLEALPEAWERAHEWVAGPTAGSGGQKGWTSAVEAGLFQPDEARGELDRMDRALERVDRGLQELRQFLVWTRAVGEVPQDDFWCLSCARGGVRSPVPVGEHLCEFCGAFKAEYGRMPPVPLIDKRARGLRITVQEVERALGRNA